MSLLTQDLKAQIKANFTISVTQGCAPLQVSFTNTSTGNPSSFQWYVGNNVTPFTIANPSTTYLSGGSYTVKLIVSDGVNVDSLVVPNAIRVFPKPVVDFTGPTEGCIPFTANFTDLTTTGGSTIVEYNWTFGVGSSSQQNPVVQYGTPGVYSVSLGVRDNNGCTGSKQVNSMLTIKNQPTANFTVNPAKACEPPLLVNFNADETGNYSFAWNMGAVGNFTGRNLSSIPFNSSGSYPITLTVSGPGGCNATKTVNSAVVISKPTANFTLPAKLCKGQAAVFTNTSTAANSYVWSFGSTQTSPSFTFNTAGTQTITLVARNSDGCVDSITKQMVVEDPQISFQPTSYLGCFSPESVSFTSNATGVSTYSWNFGSAGTSTQANPTNSFAEGTYNVVLQGFSPSGCVAQATGTVTIRRIKPNFNISNTNGGCVPLSIAFTDASTSDFPIVSWNWNFGDGTPNSTAQNPGTHVYTQSGDYTVTLTVTNDKGCTETITKTIITGEKPDVDFYPPNKVECASANILFSDSSKVKGDYTLVDFWRWTLTAANGSYNAASRNASFSNRYDTGYWNIELIAGYNGCLDTLKRFNYFYQYGPIIKTSSVNTPCDTVALFTADIIDYDSVFWDFGDGKSKMYRFGDGNSLDSDPLDPGKDTTWFTDADHNKLDAQAFDHKVFNIQHVYPAGPANFPVSITAYKRSRKTPDGIRDTVVDCSFTASLTAKIPEYQAAISFPDTICHRTQYSMIATNPGLDGQFFDWYLDGVKVTANGNTLPSYTIANNRYTTSGTHQIMLVVKYTNNGCNDTTYKDFVVLKPEPVITMANPGAGCAPLKVQFKGLDNSPIPVSKWMWNFGVGANPGTSLLQNPDSVLYQNVGSYPVTLTTTDVYGCSFTVNTNSPITVTSPKSSFTLAKSAICLGDTIKITNNSTPSAGANYQWILSNGMTSSAKTPLFIPTNYGNIDIKLVVDIGGVCYDTSSRALVVDPMPVADFKVDGPSSSSCYPFIGVKFVSLTPPLGFAGYSYKWELGEGSISDNDTASTGYFQPGKFTVKLKVTSAVAGCVDSISKVDYIEVRGPSANYSISDSVVCVKDDILFKIDNKQNVDSFYWDFGDGIIIKGTTDSIYHNYLVTGSRLPIVVIQSGDCQIALSDSVFVNDVIARIQFPLLPDVRAGSDTIFACDSLTLSSKFLPPVTGKVDRFFWNPGNGDPINNTDTTFVSRYEPGFYEMWLAVGDSASGCVDTLRQYINVYNKPTINAGANQIICKGDSAVLQAIGANTYLWSPASGLNRTDSAVVKASPTQNMQYEVLGTDVNGCTNRDTMILTVDQTAVGFSIAPKTACDSLILTPINTSVGSRVRWLVDNNLVSTQYSPSFVIKTPGQHIIRLEIYDTLAACTQSLQDTVLIHPAPFVDAPPSSLMCNGDSVFLNTTVSGNGTLSVSWSPSTGLSNPNINSPWAKPSVKTFYTVTVTDDFCTNTDTLTVDVDNTLADFSLADTLGCGSLSIQITNNSVGTNYFWQFTNLPGDIATVPNPTFTYTNPGTYTLRLRVYDKDIQCAAFDSATVVVRPIPNVTVTSLKEMCYYDSIQFVANGSDHYKWTPSTELSNDTIAAPYCYSDTSGTWTVVASDDFGCSNTASVSIVVHPDFTFTVPQSDTLVIGQSKLIDLNPQPFAVQINWTSVGSIPCSTCPSNMLGPLNNTCYNVQLVDTKNCYPKSAQFCLYIKEQYTLDVPNTFTPNGDGVNDVLFVRGYGLKRLIAFTIYNRWGEVVFETDDFNKGWDGKFKDKIQNDDTYVFQVSAETFRGEILSRQGYISLLK